ncbi:ketopantoate hydroxymethyltransferase [Arthrobacter sp. PAMC 25486]|uniref:3-methyl-2-oxobutanoate hydroxymethyltransferase n=1 Tax=Arthrobacter sp. PAMC 25486 TaxID=1494608 RepID=UPI000535BB9F|nr:3-methyl-2-oxobutanoate hydroxymethyltransferase [Arthrobacter sp. PAMC 25486]AIX99735.1 ketopantoate hydroxymethyltransferase [Arthrobacter sp. PAMC 25486]
MAPTNTPESPVSAQDAPSSEPALAAELPAPYGAPAATGVPAKATKVRTHHLQAAKRAGEKFAMLTAYDQYTAQIFDEAGIEVLLVGDSASNNVLGNETSLPITLDEMIVFSRAVTNGATRALVVADLPFGSYEQSPEQAIASSVRLMKEGLVHAVKMEGGAYYAPTVRALTQAGIPVMAHIGFTPQAEHVLGGYRVQGRGELAQTMIDDAVALVDAGAFCVLMEMVPADTAAAVDAAIAVPTVGIGAGNSTTGQVLVWQDMAGLRTGKMAKFVKQYAQLSTVLADAAKEYADEVRSGTFPGPEHTF